MGDLLARVDRATQSRVLCGILTCRGEIARIDATINTETGATERTVSFAIGWTQRREDQTWVLSAHAAKRIRQGKTPRLRRPYQDSETTAFESMTIGEFIDAEAIRSAPTKGTRARIHEVSRSAILPARARCPQCDWFQVLDPVALGLSPQR